MGDDSGDDMGDDRIISGIREVMTQEIGADTQKTRSSRPFSHHFRRKYDIPGKHWAI